MWPPAGAFLGTLASACVAWIVTVARRGADLPTAAVDWGTGVWSLVVLGVLAVLIAVLAPFVLRRRGTGIGCCCLMTVAVLVPLPTPGWPPSGWVFVACDVGQGDALVLRTGSGSGMVVDAGPDPAAVDELPTPARRHQGPAGAPHALPRRPRRRAHRCRSSGRATGAIETTSLLDPPEAVAAVSRDAKARGLPTHVSPYGVTRRIGDVTFQVLWPLPDSPTEGPGDGSTANDASVVVLAEVSGVRVLLSGDLEPVGQAALARSLPDLQVDVLKVPHHGSRHQDLSFLLGLGARFALVSAGEDNDYGHPAPETVGATRGDRRPGAAHRSGRRPGDRRPGR